MKLLKTSLLAAAALYFGIGGAAYADVTCPCMSVTSANTSVVTGNTSGAITAGPSPSFVGSTASATFTLTGQLGFDNTAAQNTDNTGDLNSTFLNSDAGGAPTIGGYSGSGTTGGAAGADFTSQAKFLASSGSAGSYQYASLWTIDLGTLPIGTVLTITHDDGIAIYQGGSPEGSPTAGATSKVTDTITLTSTADTTLYYTRQNGTPSILMVSEQLPVGVPEPTSLALLGAGLLGLGVFRRRRKAVRR